MDMENVTTMSTLITTTTVVRNITTTTTTTSLPPLSCEYETCRCLRSYQIGYRSGVRLWDVFCLIPALAMLAFLLVKLKRSLQKLLMRFSLIFSSFFVIVWTATVVQVLRAVVSIVVSAALHSHAVVSTADKIMWVMANSTLFAAEVSAVLISIGYKRLETAESPRRVLRRWFWAVLCLTLLYMTVELVLELTAPDGDDDATLFEHGGPIFTITACCLFGVVYTVIVFLHFSTRFRSNDISLYGDEVLPTPTSVTSGESSGQRRKDDKEPMSMETDDQILDTDPESNVTNRRGSGQLASPLDGYRLQFSDVARQHFHAAQSFARRRRTIVDNSELVQAIVALSPSPVKLFAFLAVVHWVELVSATLIYSDNDAGFCLQTVVFYVYFVSLAPLVYFVFMRAWFLERPQPTDTQPLTTDSGLIHYVPHNDGGSDSVGSGGGSSSNRTKSSTTGMPNDTRLTINFDIFCDDVDADAVPDRVDDDPVLS